MSPASCSARQLRDITQAVGGACTCGPLRIGTITGSPYASLHRRSVRTVQESKGGRSTESRQNFVVLHTMLVHERQGKYERGVLHGLSERVRHERVKPHRFAHDRVEEREAVEGREFASKLPTGGWLWYLDCCAFVLSC
jgi:hypothetical protein